MSQYLRYFLPNWDDLSYEQKKIINLPFNKNYLIQGSPETGISILALIRASKIAITKNEVVDFLVPTRHQMLYLRSIIQSDRSFRNVIISTYHSWIHYFYQKNISNIPVPIINSNRMFNYDWAQIKEDFRGISSNTNHIIINDAQDFPIELIEALTMVAENITCFVDPNQAIEENKTHIVEMIKKICFEPNVYLTENFRNTKEIAKLSEKFWVGNGHPLTVPNEKLNGKKPHVIICVNDDDHVEKITRIIKINEGLLIGIIGSENNIYDLFRTLECKLDGEVDIELYNPLTNNNSYNFFTPGVKVISYNMMNSMEFDLVILTRFDAMDRCINSETGEFDEKYDMQRAYVAITRARYELYITCFNYHSESGCANVTPTLFKNADLITLE